MEKRIKKKKTIKLKMLPRGTLFPKTAASSAPTLLIIKLKFKDIWFALTQNKEGINKNRRLAESQLPANKTINKVLGSKIENRFPMLFIASILALLQAPLFRLLTERL